jgi:hypothetical protein
MFQAFRQQLAQGALGFGALVFATLAAANPAQAGWLKAESERFIVYSDGNANQLRRFTQELESFDRLLRVRMGLNLEEATYRKLPIYLVGSSSGINKVSPGSGDTIAGFYLASEEDIFGIATRDGDMHTLKHEYAHHFMMQNFSFAYPAWFIEGFAEYFATAEFKSDEIHIGKYHENRAYWLVNGSWTPMDDLLSSRPKQSTRHRETYYPLAWLLTHWFMSDTKRRRSLSAYLADVGQGGDSVEAMQRATGLAPTELQRTLRRYMNSRMSYVVMKTSFDAAEVAISPMPRSADDLLLLNQRLMISTPEDQRAATVRDVRRAAARHPDDPLALLALGHAELHFGDRAAAEAPLTRLIELHPNHVEGLQYLARARMEAAAEQDDSEAALRLRQEAQTFLARAYREDDVNYATLLLIAENRAGEPGYPNDNDLAVLTHAYQLAPQLGVARVNLAQALLGRGRNAEAVVLLEPVVNNPHGEAGYARTLLARAKGEIETEDDASTPIEIETAQTEAVPDADAPPET